MLQRLLRKTELRVTEARRLTRNSRMQENFDVTLSKKNCVHHELCGCILVVKGISPATEGFLFEGDGSALTMQFDRAGEKMGQYKWTSPMDRKLYTEPEAYFLSRVKADSTVRVIENPPPYRYEEYQSTPLPDLHPDVRSALLRSDVTYMRKIMPRFDFSLPWMQKEVWRENDRVPSLQALCVRKFSAYYWATGTQNGRPFVISAMDGMETTKFADSVLQMSRHPPEGLNELLPYFPEAMNHMYRMMKIDLSAQEHIPFSLKPLEGIYLGASKGIDLGEVKEIKEGPHPIKVSPLGKKIDSFDQDLDAIMNFVLHGTEPPIWWTVSPKNENFFSWTKQWTQKEWDTWKAKIRSFYIPNSVYILLEKVVSLHRHRRERGWVICIGHPWSRGGGNTMAKRLGITLKNCYEKRVHEGDGKNFDATVAEQCVDAYWSSMLIGMKQDTEDYKIFEAIAKFLIKNMLTRVTRIFAGIWAEVHGGVPSGAFNTSHMDSWIMLLYLTLFFSHQIRTAPEDQREILEEFYLDHIMAVVYGDDHLYSFPLTEYSHVFSAENFALFMKKFFNVEMRDSKSAQPFCSKEFMGMIVEMGCTFLKHQHVVNKYRERPGQPDFLPYRESKEFMIRAVWGRETKARDPVDVLLSVIGHAYGTYASNRDAYDRLALFYQELLRVVGDVEYAKQTIRSRLTEMDLKRLRQLGITQEELMSGFPTWETLVEKNTYDMVYQDNGKEGRDGAYSYSMDEEYLEW